MAFVGGDKQLKTMDSLEVDDRIILKRGKSKIVAVGEVVERNGLYREKDDKDWLWDFDGWDLRAYCFVRWHVSKEPTPTKDLNRATINKVNPKHLTRISQMNSCKIIKM